MLQDRTEKKGSLLSTLVWLGFACFIAQAGFVLQDGGILFRFEGLSLLAMIAAPHAGFILSLFTIALVSLRRGTQYIKPPFSLSSLMICLVGFSLIAVSCFLQGPFDLAAYQIAGLALGIGEGMGFALWMDVFSRCTFDFSFRVLLGALVSCLISLGALAVPEPTGSIACVALCIFSYICAYVLQCKFPGSASLRNLPYSPSTDRPIRALMRFTWRPGVCIGAMGFMFTASRLLINDSSLAFIAVFTSAGTLMTCVALLLAFKKRAGVRLAITSVYIYLFPLNALLFVLSVFFGGWYYFALVCVASFCFHVCTILMVFQAAEYSRDLGLPAYTIYSMLSGISHLLLFCGYPMVYFGANALGMALYPVVAAIVVYILSMGLMASILDVRSGKLQEEKGKSEDRSIEDGIPSVSKSMLKQKSKNELPRFEDLTNKAGEPTRQERCLPEGCKLSPREKEMLSYLLIGRDVPYIAERLCLSKNTVRTHVHNLYGKLDVHSRQELLTLFERDGQMGTKDHPPKE